MHHCLSDLDQIFAERAVVAQLMQFCKLVGEAAAVGNLFLRSISFYFFHHSLFRSNLGAV